MAYGIALDIGTSGTRGHAVDLSTGKILSTVVTECHPMPGANIMDHLTFCIKVGNDTAHRILMDTVNKVIANMGIDLKQVERVSICGNPIQLSLFQLDDPTLSSLRDTLRQADLNNMTPLQAFDLLRDMKKELNIT